MEKPKYLFHYTNIETLALILKNRTIRFNSLDKMDDLQEQQTADISNIGQFCYISSWSEDEIESIPMWNMYATLDKGVRIKMRTNPFKSYDYFAEDFKDIPNATVTDYSNGKAIRSIIPLKEMYMNGYFSPQAMNDEL